MFTSQTQIKVVDRIDHLAKSLTEEQIEALYQCEKSELMLESVTLEDLENTLLFQCEPVPQMMLEAFKSKASQLAVRVKKFANQLERQTPNLTCGEIEIGKPRKSGAVAVQVAKIPLSDGQSVSIAFHAPDNDPLQINADDTLIAFRFLLNSRDVTHAVAAKGGQDVSLKEATTKLGALAEKNSDKFTAAQTKKNADATALEEAQEKAQELEEQAALLNSEATDLEIKGDEVEMRIKRLQTQIDTQNEIQDELRKQLAKKQAPAATATSDTIKLVDTASLVDNRVKFTDWSKYSSDEIAIIKHHDKLQREAALADDAFQKVIANHKQGNGMVTEAFRQTKEYKDAKYNWDLADANAKTYRALKPNKKLLLQVSKERLDNKKKGHIPESKVSDDDSTDPVLKLFRNPKLKAAVEAARKVEGGSRAFSTLGTIAGIDVAGEKGMDRSLFVSNMTGRIKTLHKNGNQEAVDAILAMVAAYNDVAPKAAITARNNVWMLGSKQGSDNVIHVSFNESEFQSNLSGEDKATVQALRDAGYQVLFENDKGYSIIQPNGGVVATGSSYPTFKEHLEYYAEQVAVGQELDTNASSQNPADQHQNYGYLVEDSRGLPTNNSLNKLKPSDLESGEYVIEYGEHSHITVKKVGGEIQATWVVAGGLDVDTASYPSVSKLKHFGAQKMDQLGGAVSERLFKNGYTQEELDKAASHNSNVVNLNGNAKASEENVDPALELKGVGDVVRIGESVCVIENIDVESESATMYDREDDYRFVADKSLLERNKVYLKGIHKEYEAISGNVSLVDELKPIIKDLPTDGWFYDNGNPTFKFNDDIYDALRAKDYSIDDARIKAQQLKDEIIMGNIDYFANFHDQPAEAQEPEPQEDVEIDSNLFWYGLRARPFSIGAAPSIQQSAILTAEQAQVAFPSVGNSVRHGAVGYSEQLSDNEVSSFEFVPLFETTAAIDDEDIEYTARELLLGWLDSKGLSTVEKNEIDTLVQAVSLGNINSVFAKVIRELPVFKNRKSDKKEYDQFRAELEAIDAEVLKRVADEMGIVAVKGDNADEATKGKTEEEKQLLALDPNEFTFGAIYDTEGRQDGKTIASRIRAFITQGKKQGKLPKDLKISVKNQRGGFSTAIIMRITDLPESIRVNSDAALQSAIDNDGRLAYGQSRYSEELTNLIKYVEAYVDQFNHLSGDAYGDYGYDHALYGNHLQLDAAFSNERWVQELESFTEAHQSGDETEKPELDVNGIRDALDEDGKLQLEQLEEFTGFKIQLGKQELILPNGKAKSRTINDESDVEWVINEFHDDLAIALEEKAVAQLESLTNWQSEHYYYGDDFQGHVKIDSSINTSHSDSDAIDGLYGRKNLTAAVGTRFVRIYPVVKAGEFKFAAYSNDSSKHFGDFTNHSELEMLCIFALELSDKQPEQENSDEMEHVDKVREIRDYSGEATLEVLEQFQAELEAAYSHFEESGTYAENEALMEAAFANYVALQDQVAA
ncbi:TPA: hypothetical protein N2826_003953 [Vibrio parahaemolyticus]|uniref:defense against restriction DarA-related protein n=1 Tax=Vibrio parahaemolyticus TaxID=670 RepID=UPI001121564B|nr:hypothetical protein [Vibrio parahaemolyticus]MBE4286421.1 hypothetical protein [Vibrio parahaemolyticus]TOH19003.1 hypothetical protein CGI90_04145 [Vibrio parahaemolyticus]HCM0797992.1 hypothetical protein [Vibrio parahaemolyticus]HCM0883470.1 hypothetical protein [Vibrio parahaemolyticus]HCM1326687.1 hypothetical protein [Vibrio parahaemolyticus]